MTDPLEILRTPDSPVEPDPTFAARLRRRLAAALELPKGVTASNVVLEPEGVGDAPSRTAASTVTPYLCVANGERAIAWYEEALGARVRGSPIRMPDGGIGHAELEVGGAPFMLADEFPEHGLAAPVAGGPVSVSLHLGVDDVDAVLERAAAAGATIERAAADFEHGRNGVLRDPFGHRWLVSATAAPAARHGEVVYGSVNVPDAARAATFYGAVLGWEFEAVVRDRSRHVAGRQPALGIWGDPDRTDFFACYAVRDLRDALDRVRAGGGTAGPAERQPWGDTAECTDDTGTPFALTELAGGVGSGARSAPASRPGDLVYLTMEVVDSGRARAFYGSVLGWTFSAGHVADGWQVADRAPMVGMHGGHDHAMNVPMYRVGDISAAVARVRAAGGTATDPERQPYGTSSLCRDDQGSRFFLGEL